MSYSNKISYQEEIPLKNYLNSIIESNSFSNAYIFSGPDGVGKTVSALYFISKILKLKNPNYLEKGKFSSINHPDIFLIEPTYVVKGNLVNQSQSEEGGEEDNKKNKAIIRVDQIRNIKSFLSKKAIQSEKKFVLILDAHLLNEASSNCLLKTLEEPNNGHFILITSKQNALIETVISRCQIIHFKPFTQGKLKKIALETFQEITQKDQNNHLDDLIYISNGSPHKLINNIKTWQKIPESIREAIKFPILNIYNALLLAKTINDELIISEQKFLVDFLQFNWWVKTRDREIIEILEKLKYLLTHNVQPRLSWEVTLIKLSLKRSYNSSIDQL